VDFPDHYKEEAKKRQERKPNSVTQKVAEQNTGEAAAKAAEDLHTNKQCVKDCAKVKEEDPEVFEKINVPDFWDPP